MHQISRREVLQLGNAALTVRITWGEVAIFARSEAPVDFVAEGKQSYALRSFG